MSASIPQVNYEEGDGTSIRAGRSQFRWTEAAKLQLAKRVKSRKGHFTTPDLNLTDKFRLIRQDLKDKPETADLDITSDALMNHFNRLQSGVLDKYGISKEGANLSGLDEVPSEYVSLMITMAEEKAKEKKKKSTKKNKKKTVQRVMANIEQAGLNRQSNLGHDLDPSTPSSREEEAEENEPTSRSSRQGGGMAALTGMHDDLMTILQDNDDEGAALEKELKRAKIDEPKQKAELGKVQLEREKQELEFARRKQELEIKLLERQLQSP